MSCSVQTLGEIRVLKPVAARLQSAVSVSLPICLRLKHVCLSVTFNTSFDIFLFRGPKPAQNKREFNLFAVRRMKRRSYCVIRASKVNLVMLSFMLRPYYSTLFPVCWAWLSPVLVFRLKPASRSSHCEQWCETFPTLLHFPVVLCDPSHRFVIECTDWQPQSRVQDSDIPVCWLVKAFCSEESPCFVSAKPPQMKRSGHW